MSMFDHVETGRLTQLADFLESVPPADFNIHEWTERAYEAPSPAEKFLFFTITPASPGCGFAGCAMGWAAHARLFPGLTLQRGTPTFKGAMGYPAADKLFGLAPGTRRKMKLFVDRRGTIATTNTAFYLFGADQAYKHNPQPADVADRIRRFVAKVESRKARNAARVERPTLHLVSNIA
jgi:hypothetical protein